MNPVVLVLSLVLSEPVLPALIVFAVVVIATRAWKPAPASPSPRARAVQRLLRIGALLVLLVDVGVRAAPLVVARLPFDGDLLTPGGYAWWQFPLPLAAAVVILVVALVRSRAEPARVETPVVPLTRRNWLTFSRQRDVVIAASTGGALLLLSVLSGLASATDRNGLHTIIVMRGGDFAVPDDIDTSIAANGPWSSFYGWAYGVPVMVLAVILALVLWLALRTDAARPFVRPEDVAADTADRAAAAIGAWRLAAAALGLTFGAALAFVAYAGLSSTGVGVPGLGTATWSLGYSSFAPAMLGLSVLVRIAATVSLLLLVRGARTRPARVSASAVAVQP